MAKMTIRRFIKAANNGGFNPVAFLLENFAWMLEQASNQSLKNILSDYKEGKLLPTVAIQSFAKELNNVAMSNLAKEIEDKANKPAKVSEPKLISCEILIQVFDKESQSYKDEWETYVEQEKGEEPKVWVKECNDYGEGLNWTLNKLHIATSPRVKGVITDNRWDKPIVKEYTTSQGDEHKTRKLGGNLDTKYIRKPLNLDKPLKPGQTMRVKG